ncbi:MAG: helix-turn-helix domain containing protein [Mycobacterium sp.]|jgi:AcrR family transcriptional regulator|nr:helix-turn-helix domain containing protein [Mycobacterium sp.]
MPADRILDAAGELFAARGIASVDMKDIARAAGCSRATLYRYFENRDALHTAYVHREARMMGTHLTGVIADIDDPRERLLAGVMHALQLVRDSPALSAWFTTSAGADAADRSEVVRAMTAAFLESLDPGDAAVDRRARWLVRILTSLLLSPGHDLADERAMLAEFVIPLVGPKRLPSGA